MKRTINDDCLLCKKNKAIRTNSHIVPATLLNCVHGKRDKEHSFQLSTNSPNIVEYFGREFSQNETEIITKSNFSCDYILCDTCEKYFGDIESLVNPIFKDCAVKQIHVNKHLDFEYIEINKLNGSVISLYFYSIIWRLIIQDSIDNFSIIESIKETEKDLRNMLMGFRNLNQKDLRKITIQDNFKLQVITASQEFYPISQFFNFYSENPYFFIAGPFVLYLFNKSVTLEGKALQIIQHLDFLLNYGNKNFRIFMFPNENYNMIISQAYKLFFSKLTPLEIESYKEICKNTKK